MGCNDTTPSVQKLIIVTGQTASGKSTFASFLHESGFSVCEFSQFFDHVLGPCSTSASDRLQRVIEYIASIGRPAYIDQLLAWTAGKSLAHDERPLVLVGARHPRDIDLLRHHACVVEVIGITSAQDRRIQRTVLRDRASDLHPERFALPDPQVEDCLARYATIRICNDGSLEDLASSARKLALRFPTQAQDK